MAADKGTNTECLLVSICCTSVMKHFLLLLTVAAVASQQSCRTKQFQYCQTLLAEGVGLNSTMSSLMFKDYTVLYNWFLYKWGLTPGNTTNMLNVCNQLEFFNGCMGSDRGCFQIQNLIQGTDLNNAFFIDGTLAMYQFNCGPGLNTLLHEGVECAQLVIDGYQNYLQQCVSTYMSSIIHDYGHGCRYVKNLMNCWSAPFGGSEQIPPPGCSRAGAADVWWACEANRVFTLGQFPNCGYSCDVQQQSMLLEDHLKTHHKCESQQCDISLTGECCFSFENGLHYYKIPNYMATVDGKVQLVEGQWMNN